jgi:Helicase conserved C-terminal domain
MCVHRECAFHGRRQPRGIPILAVDEPIYRRLPAFLIATVDKFANLPWVGDTGGLFGRVDRHDAEGFYGPTKPGRGAPLPRRLPPPDLVIQDELHLISGPLGTMVGLYETAIDALASADLGGDGPRPKIVASTATVRRAERQIRALFGRTEVEVFPPPGPDRRDSFFAVTVRKDERNPRTYLGIAAQGRNLKVVLLRTCLALMAAAQKAWNDSGGDRREGNPADPYMTLLGYFNSLRELGGSRRIVEDEVKSRLVDYEVRRRRERDPTSLFANRPRWAEPRELTSRVSTDEVAATKRRLALPFADSEHVDVALATNMISVGLDIQRLGLMVVLGQPKTASEYIQATSRVGRDDERPGLVVTLLNLYRPRDRSHYERFCAWHESFYRSVEATSVTPFSPRAIDRGIAAVTVALARLGHPAMTAPRGALAVKKQRAELDVVADVLARRAEGHDAQLGAEEAEKLRVKVKERVHGLLDAWQILATRKGDLQYQKEVGVSPPLLFDPLDPELAKQTKDARDFKANRSLRDVEPTVNLWLRNPNGTMAGEESE